jgi:hypothetical protein
MKVCNNFTQCREIESPALGFALRLTVFTFLLTGCVAGPTPHPSDPEDPAALQQDEGEDPNKGNEATGADAYAGSDVSTGDACADVLTFDSCDPPNVSLDGDVGPDGLDGASDGQVLDTASDGDDGGDGAPTS